MDDAPPPQKKPKTGGRKKGVPNKTNAKTREELWAYCAQQGVNPFTFLVDVIANKRATLVLRAQCARELAPFLLGKMKQVEHNFDDDTRKVIRVILSGQADD